MGGRGRGEERGGEGEEGGEEGEEGGGEGGRGRGRRREKKPCGAVGVSVV